MTSGSAPSTGGDKPAAQSDTISGLWGSTNADVDQMLVRLRRTRDEAAQAAAVAAEDRPLLPLAMALARLAARQDAASEAGRRR